MARSRRGFAWWRPQRSPRRPDRSLGQGQAFPSARAPAAAAGNSNQHHDNAGGNGEIAGPKMRRHLKAGKYRAGNDRGARQYGAGQAPVMPAQLTGQPVQIFGMYMTGQPSLAAGLEKVPDQLGHFGRL